MQRKRVFGYINGNENKSKEEEVDKRQRKAADSVINNCKASTRLSLTFINKFEFSKVSGTVKKTD